MDKAILVGLDLGKYNIDSSLEELENKFKKPASIYQWQCFSP